jgi:hypothetical protein
MIRFTIFLKETKDSGMKLYINASHKDSCFLMVNVVILCKVWFTDVCVVQEEICRMINAKITYSSPGKVTQAMSLLSRVWGPEFKL